MAPNIQEYEIEQTTSILALNALQALATMKRNVFTRRHRITRMHSGSIHVDATRKVKVTVLHVVLYIVLYIVLHRVLHIVAYY